ncbi:MAG: hypothetical protein RBS33_14775, partial [Lentimicrobium sp.]|nr:hypothetical protein [Lentimicrobium sp.]
MFRGILLFFLVTLGIAGSAQKEYYNWYFGGHCSITFNNGTPQPLPEGNNYGLAGAAISDSMGNLLFYTDGYVVYDKINRPTPNGIGLHGKYCYQGSIILQVPGKKNLYYITNVFHESYNPLVIPETGILYSVFDITLNNGFGDIVEGQKNIPIYLPSSGYAANKLTAVRHRNNNDIWIITRSFPGDKFYSFLLSSEGLSTVGLISQSLINISYSDEPLQHFGEVNISPDGTKFAAAYSALGCIEYGAFNTETGRYTPQFIISPDTICSGLEHSSPVGIEFSPDSKLLYCCHNDHSNFECAVIQQFDVSIPDSALVKQSEITIGIGVAGLLQTGPDGKIYGGLFGDNRLSVIHNPNARGLFCNFQFASVSLGEGNREYFYGLPQMLQKYFSYINYTAACTNQPTLFTPNIYPVPDSVCWNFGDASSGVNDTSTLLNTSHVYHTPGDYSVSLISYWPGGRSNTSVKVISVLPAPFPNIGDTAFICKGDSVALESDIFESYLWS